MRITIVTAVFNAQATIADALRSVADQSHPDIEHLVMDGGSTDGTIDAIQSSDCDRITLVREPDDGIYDALNKGILRATGEVVGLVHADDFFAHPDVIKQVAAAFSDPQVDAVYGDLDYVAATDTTRIIRHWKAGEYRPARLKWGWMPPHPTLFLRRRVFERHGLYDTRFRIAADYEAILRYFAKGGVRAVYLPEVLVKMRVGGESNRNLERIWTKSREDYAALRQNRVGGLPTLVAKNLSKLPQFFIRS